MPVSKKRRKSLLGTRTLVCGIQVSREFNLICLLPVNIRHTTHASLAVDDENHLVLAFRTKDSKETEWQLVSDPAEQFMSLGRQSLPPQG